MPSIRVHKNLFILDSFQIRINRSYVKRIKIKKIKIHTATSKEASHRYFFFLFFFFRKTWQKRLAINHLKPAYVRSLLVGDSLGIFLPQTLLRLPRLENLSHDWAPSGLQWLIFLAFVCIVLNEAASAICPPIPADWSDLRTSRWPAALGICAGYSILWIYDVWI